MTVVDRRFGGSVVRTQRACDGAAAPARPSWTGVPSVAATASSRSRGTHPLKIPPNARDGYATTQKGAGDDVFYDGGHVRRDVTVVVEEESHAELQRVGSDLVCAKRGASVRRADSFDRRAHCATR